MSELRRTWPGPMSTAGVGEGHSHEWPAPLLRRVRLLTRAVVIFGVCLAVFVYLFVSLIQSRSAERRAQNDRIQQEIRDSWCTALDTFPEGGELDDLRVQYDCGPGIPLSDLPPDQADRLREWRGDRAEASDP